MYVAGCFMASFYYSLLVGLQYNHQENNKNRNNYHAQKTWRRDLSTWTFNS